MEAIRIDSRDIADLDIPVAVHGAIRTGETAADELFELVVAIVSVVYELNP
ncbi:MAG: hypothetical protein ACOY45_14460 [Pseudomonadota bacterium]